MSQSELIARLHQARPEAPAELRERVREIAAQAPAPRRVFTWRRALVVLVPVAAAAALAAAFLPRGGNPTATETLPELTRLTPHQPSATKTLGELGSAADATAATAHAATGSAFRLSPAVPQPSGSRIQDYSATLALRLPNPNAVSKATTRALQIAASLGGYPLRVRVDAAGKHGSAYLVLRVPRTRVQEAVRRLGALGTIVGENVSIQDLQAGVDSTGRLIARLQKQLTTLREQPQTEELTRQIAALTARVERLQRARAATIRTARYATVELELNTPPKPAVPVKDDGDGPLHNLGVAFVWAGIGAVYALALGAPLAALLALGWFLARGARRRREERLLSRP